MVVDPPYIHEDEEDYPDEEWEMEVLECTYLEQVYGGVYCRDPNEAGYYIEVLEYMNYEGDLKR